MPAEAEVIQVGSHILGVSPGRGNFRRAACTHADPPLAPLENLPRARLSGYGDGLPGGPGSRSHRHSPVAAENVETPLAGRSGSWGGAARQTIRSLIGS